MFKKLFKAILTFIAALALFLLLVAAYASRPELRNYVNKEDKSARVEKVEKVSDDRTHMEIVSQTWQDIEWKHNIEIYTPEGCGNEETAVLYLATFSGEQNIQEAGLCQMIAKTAKIPVVMLDGIPNQPLFHCVEDRLIAYTIAQTLRTGDTEWPLLLPMVKSAVAAMKAVRENTKIKSFIVTGVSKRGWTTWLTAAAVPEMCKAIVPVVYDNLDIPAQMTQQALYFGDLNDAISDYKEIDVSRYVDDPLGRKIIDIMDPYSYLDRITMPKMIFCGTNDPYWTVDSLNLYWNDLKGEKYVTYYENGGHDLGFLGPDKISPMLKVTKAFTGFVNAVRDDAYPHAEWKYILGNKAWRLNVVSEDEIVSAKVWRTHSSNADFKKAKWTSEEMTKTEKGYTYKLDAPENGCDAFFADLTVKKGEVTMPMSTQIKVVRGIGTYHGIK
ncbi:MAG: hypothetical protein J6332_01330 [Abditibacteriota bacterium]|nr:hypothetical protein [Abditibacteriota bacterium]